MTVAIIDYGSGNLRSAAKAFERAAWEAGLDQDIVVTADAQRVAEAERIVLPGVGAFADCLRGLESLDGMREALERAVVQDGRPFLGICVGMQLLASRGEEFGGCDGLGWIPGAVVPLAPSPSFRAPHMGWNAVTAGAPHPVFDGLDGEAFYFAHSFHFVAENPAHSLGLTAHGEDIAALIGRDNLIGAQFHPEKSQTAGLAFLSRFLGWSPS